MLETHAVSADTMTWQQRAHRRIPQGTQVASKGWHRYCRGFGPSFIEDADGCRVLSDGKWYIDWTMGLGAVTLGHKRGVPGLPGAYPLPTKHEVALAELVHAWVPCANQVRFLKTGSDATSAAVRLARAYTGRDLIVRSGYHGFHDWALNADYQEKKGIPQCVRDMTLSVPFNDLESLEDIFLKRFKQVAAFILEPVSLHAPYSWYLPRVRDLCQQSGALLIFDEVITGFRMAPGGAQEVYGVTPDLCAMGKAMANGHPISLVAGRREVMQMFSETHISGTHFAEPLAMQNALYNLDEMERQGFWKHQALLGERLIAGYRRAAEHNGLSERTRIKGLPHFTCIDWNDEAEQTLWQQEMLRDGILVASGQFICLAHGTAEVDQTIAAYERALAVVAEARDNHSVAEQIEGDVNQTTFRRH